MPWQALTTLASPSPQFWRFATTGVPPGFIVVVLHNKEVKHSKRSALSRSCFIVSTASVLLGVLSFFRAVSFCVHLCVLASSECSRMGGRRRRSTRTDFSGAVTAATSFSSSLVTFLLEWFVLMIEAPDAILLHSNEARTHAIRENWNIEASRTIAGALTREPWRCHVASGARKSAEIYENLPTTLRLELRAPT